MKTILIEAPIPNSTFAKYDSQKLSPNILLDIGGAINSNVALQYELLNREKVNIQDADRYVINISECVEKPKHIKNAKELIKSVQMYTSNPMFSNNQEVWLSGWYPWLYRKELEGFKIVDHMFYEKHFNDDLKSPVDCDPKWDLFDWNLAPVINKRRKASLRTSRGCLNKCNMCPVNSLFNGKMFVFPIEWVERQINELYHKHDIREINFIDDNFLFTKKRAVEMLEFLIESKYDIKYFFQEGMTVDIANDEDVVKLLKEAKFKDIKLGVESLNPKTLELINKPYKDPAKVITAIELLNKYKFTPICFVLLGLPTDTEKDIEDMINTFSKLKVRTRVQSVFDYPNMEYKTSIPKDKIDKYKRELLLVTNSLIWK